LACPFAAGGGPADSDGRVAQAGNGNSTADGTGISGCETNIAPGLARVARWRCDGGSGEATSAEVAYKIASVILMKVMR
jgi:hypothetical protein